MVKKIFEITLIILFVVIIGGVISWSIQEIYYLRAEQTVLELDEHLVGIDRELDEFEEELDEDLEQLKEVTGEEEYKRVEEYTKREKEYENRAEIYNEAVLKVDKLMEDLEEREYFLPIPVIDIVFVMEPPF